MRFANPDEGRDPSAAMRADLERWLERALAGEFHVPRIPIRRADRGGFDELMASTGGRDAALAWWQNALSTVELD